MSLSRLVLTIALATAVPAMAHAQVATADPYGPEVGPVESHWIASGYVGSNFGSDADEASVNFGGSLGYLWNGVFGAEFLASFSPEFELDPARSALLNGEQPWINSYMLNAVGAVPIGEEGRWRPYISGGLGALSLRSDTLLTNGQDDFELDPDDTQFAGNVGAGIMGFMNDNIGLRGEVRYYRGFEQNQEIDPIEDPTEQIGSQVLSELGFWRANVGVAFRW